MKQLVRFVSLFVWMSVPGEFALAVDSLAPTHPSAYTTHEAINSKSETHSFTLKNGRTFQFKNPSQTPELARAMTRLNSLSEKEQLLFAERRRDALVAIARLFSSGKILPVKFTNSVLEYFDDSMIASAPAVVGSNDFGLNLTTNISGGLGLPSMLAKKAAGAHGVFAKGGAYLGAGGGINIGFIPEEKTAYLEVMADFENLDTIVTPMLQLSHTYRAYFYGRAGNQSYPIEIGRVTNAPIPLVTGMNTDRGFYIGVAGGPSLVTFLGPIFKNIILPALDQITTYTTKFYRVHLLKITGTADKNGSPLSIEIPILNHPMFESTASIRAAMKNGNEKLKAKIDSAQNFVYDRWPETPSCITTLGL